MKTQKRIGLVSAIGVLIMASFIGCTPNGPSNEGDGISCPESISFGVEGGSKTITINTESQWKAAVSDDWITVSPNKGYEDETDIRVTVEAGKKAEGSVLFRNRTGGEAKMKVYRGKDGENPDPDNTSETLVVPSDISSEPNGGDLFFHIKSETDWEVEEDIEWLSFSPTSGPAGQEIMIMAYIDKGHHKDGVVYFHNKKDQVSMHVYRGWHPSEGDYDVVPTKKPTKIEGCLPGLFRISRDRQVYFSMGNLTYFADSWSFANHQYEVNLPGNNEAPLAKDHPMDKFAWGTSGWDSGAQEYKPTSLTGIGTDDYYQPGGDPEADLTGKYARADWGVYNAISNGGNKPGLWRTLTYEEWEYVTEKRPHWDDLQTEAIVCDIYGAILLPDNWDWNKWEDKLVICRYEFEQNIIDSNLWKELQADGAVFLPITGGYRGDNHLHGGYWSTTHASSLSAYIADVSDRAIVNGSTTARKEHRSVRLVRAE